MTAIANADTDKLPDNVVAIIDKSVDDALRRINLDAMIREIFNELDIAGIVRRTIAEVQSG